MYRLYNVFTLVMYFSNSQRSSIIHPQQTHKMNQEGQLHGHLLVTR